MIVQHIVIVKLQDTGETHEVFISLREHFRLDDNILIGAGCSIRFALHEPSLSDPGTPVTDKDGHELVFANWDDALRATVPFALKRPLENIQLIR